MAPITTSGISTDDAWDTANGAIRTIASALRFKIRIFLQFFGAISTSLEFVSVLRSLRRSLEGVKTGGNSDLLAEGPGGAAN
jgi:hypothetical protein